MSKKINKRLELLYSELDELQEAVLLYVLSRNAEWILTGEYDKIMDRIDEIYFEIDYIELLNSNSICN